MRGCPKTKFRIKRKGSAVALGLAIGLGGTASRASGSTNLVAEVLYPIQVPTPYTNINVLDSADGLVAGSAQIPSQGISAATVWSGPSGNPILLGTPAGDAFLANATDGISIVGAAEVNTTQTIDHAILWSADGTVSTDLNPTALGFTGSIANGVMGGLQVGSADYHTNTVEVTHAFAWAGTATSAIDLNSTLLGMSNSSAVATDGVQIVGSTNSLLVLWTSPTANSAVSLLPPASLNLSMFRSLESEVASKWGTL